MSQSLFSPDEILQYQRHFVLDGFGEKAQAKLKSSRILVVGAGGLGCPALLYLAAAGVGNIGIIDFDIVEASNLHRQILYGVKDIGQLKVDIAFNRLTDLNPNIEITRFPLRLTAQNALDIFSKFDLVLDGSDNFPTRYLVNDACLILKIPLIYGSISQYEGHISVFNYSYPDGSNGPNYRDLFPTPPMESLVNNCATAGVLGVLPGIIGAMQANEAIKLLAGIGELLVGRLHVLDALTLQSRTLKINKIFPESSIIELIDYEQFCNAESIAVPSISAETFHEWQKNKFGFQLIDVRELAEYEANNIGGILIPMNSIKDRITEIQRDKTLVIHCETGARSLQAVKALIRDYGFADAYYLDGGIKGLKYYESNQSISR